MADPSKRILRRFPFRFRLRSLIIAIGVLCGILGWIISRAHTQRDTVDAIRRAGGRVMYDGEWVWWGTNVMPTGSTRWPTWLTDLVGIDYLSSVTYVDLGKGGSDELLERVGQLRRLQYLRLAGSPVSDAGVAHLEGLTALRWLSLDDTRITDAGLAHLAGLTRLEGLLLGLTNVSDAGTAHLKPLTGLKVLSLRLTSVSHRGSRALHEALPKTVIGVPGWPGQAEARALESQEQAAAKDRMVPSPWPARQRSSEPNRGAGGPAAGAIQ